MIMIENPNIRSVYQTTYTNASDPNDITTHVGVIVEITHEDRIIKHFIPIDVLMACVPLNHLMRPVGDA